MTDLAGLLRGAADFIEAVGHALDEQRTGFSEREAGDFLDTSGLTDASTPDDETPVCPCGTSFASSCAVACTDPLAKSRANAALKSVSHEDLAAHITGIQLSCLRRGMTVDATYDEIASNLLADYRITKK